jgi:hypothetical protein
LLKSRSSAIKPFLMLAVLALIALTVQAQDPFEIQIYEYETVPKGMWNLETHINYIGKGTKSFEGPVAPTNNQFHLTYELTRGITDHFETAGDLKFGENVVVNFGVGFGATEAGNRLVYKMRIGYLFGKKK